MRRVPPSNVTLKTMGELVHLCAHVHVHRDLYLLPMQHSSPRPPSSPLLLTFFSGSCLHTFLDCRDAVLAVAFSPDGSALAGAGADGAINLWDTQNCALLQHYPAHRAGDSGGGGIASIAFHPSGAFLLSGGSDAALRVWDLREGGQLFTLRGHEREVRGVAFSPDGAYFASVGGDKLVMVCTTSTATSRGERAATAAGVPWLRRWGMQSGRADPAPVRLVAVGVGAEQRHQRGHSSGPS